MFADVWIRQFSSNHRIVSIDYIKHFVWKMCITFEILVLTMQAFASCPVIVQALLGTPVVVLENYSRPVAIHYISCFIQR